MRPLLTNRSFLCIDTTIHCFVLGVAARAPVQPSWGPRHDQMYITLIEFTRPLTGEEERWLSEKPGFAIHWKALASELGFGAAEIERIRDIDHYDAERCIQLFFRWQQRAPNATVSRLVQGIYKLKNTIMLELVHSKLVQ